MHNESRRGLWGAVIGMGWALLAVGCSGTSGADVESLTASGPGMEPTLLEGRRFLIETGRAPAAGDVIVFRSDDELDLVKRVIGVAGDRIEIRDDVVLRNGTPIAVGERGSCPAGATTASEDAASARCTPEAIGDRRWTTLSSASATPESVPEATVPDGTVYVLGDHRDRSNDSRNPRIGFVPVERVHGVMTTVL